jgi:Na+/H+-dicarboxylate symporter
MKRLADLPLGLRILVGLVLGACVGVLLPGPGLAPWSDGIAYIANIAGKLWLSALQMTVLPIVFALLTIGLGRTSGTAGTGDSVARRAVFVFAALYLFSLIVAVILNQVLLDLWPVSAEATAAFGKVTASNVAADVPKAGDIILSLLPSNVFAAFAAGSMLPVVVFAVIFGLAMRRVEDSRRTQIVSLISALADVMFKIIAGVLLLAPLGVFALVLGTVHETGLAIVWGLAGYLRHVVTVATVMLVLVYPVAWLWGRIGIARFAAAAAPSQLVALSTQSSVGSLPVMLESAKTLQISEASSSVALPLAVSIFRFSGPAITLTVAAYAASAAGLHIGTTQLVAGAMLAMLMEFTAVGLPNQVSMFALYAPVFAAFGAPLGFLPVMLAVETIPDAIGTAANVSMDIAATGVVDRLQGNAPVDEPQLAVA